VALQFPEAETLAVAVIPRQRSNDVGSGSAVNCFQVSKSAAPFIDGPRQARHVFRAVSVLPPMSPPTNCSSGPAVKPARSR
jgi:hypothetical protein